MSKKNITQLQDKGYEFIIGARIKNEKKEIKEKIGDNATIGIGAVMISSVKENKTIKGNRVEN